MRHKQVLPRKATKKMNYRHYSPTSMTNAYRAVLEDKVPVKRAANTYGVPQNTLRQRVLGRVNPETTPSGPAPILSQEEEAIFVEHLKAMAEIGYGYTSKEVLSMASNYAVYLKKRDKETPFSMKWFICFMKRWPELGVNKPRPLSNYRAKATSPDVVNNYFEKMDQILTKYNLKDKPECIYNVDEKGIQTEHSPPFLVSAGRSTPAITSSRTAITTILGCGSAIGTMMPPYFILKGKRFSDTLLEGCTTGSSGTVTDSGWCNSSVFYDFLESHFIKYVQRRDAEQPVLLIFDGHKSHVNIPVINWARDNNVVLFVLPAHTSHVLQPLDVACFGPLQRIYNSECHKFIRNNPSSNVTRYSVAALSSKAYENALSPANLKSAFRRTGIFPFDRSVIDTQQLAPSSAYANPSSQAVGEEEPVISVGTALLAVTDETEPADFFIPHRDSIEKKKQLEKKVRNGIHTIVSGTSITEPETVEKIKNYENSKHLPKPTYKRKHVPTAMIKGKVPTKKMKQEICNKPGASGLQVNCISDSESDSDSTDDEVCCVCNKFQPKELKNCLSLVFTKWAQCDMASCKHWTHLIYCCKEKVIRRHGTFICPCHTEE